MHTGLRSLTFALTLQLLFAPSVYASSVELPKRQLTPGGVAIIELANSEATKPEARYNNQRVMVIESLGKWLGVIGIPLTQEPGTNFIKTKPAGTRTWIEKSFTIKNKKYTEQRLVIKDQRKVDPNQDDMKIIRQDDSKIARAKSTWSEEVLTTKLDLPVNGRRSSEFGLKRFYNGKQRKPHSGIDIAAPEGTLVLAPADGVVVEADNFFFSGNCIFIDHGQGLITFYAHMDKMSVKKGTKIKRGQKIGEVGQTGRVTGPHLHWSVGLNQTWVDPDLFLK